MAEYRIDILTASGVKQAEVDDYITLGYHNEVNSPGLAEFVLLGNNDALAYCTKNAQIEIWRKNDRIGLNWSRDFVGFLKGIKKKQTRGQVAYIFTAIDPKYLLDTRVNAYYADTSGKTSFTSTAVETVMKNIVTYNCTSSATTGNGRLRNGAITGFTVATDQTRGSSITVKNAYDNVLELLQKLAQSYAMDFNVNKTGANAWQFEVYPNQLGTDRSSTVLFSLGNGNMTNPEYTYNALEERTIAIVGGDGETTNRQIVTVTGTGYSTANDYEVFIDSRNAKGVSAVLTAAGTNALNKAIAAETFTFDVLQTPSCYYGIHYTLGDKVRSMFDTLIYTQKIQSIDVAYTRSGQEQIKVGLITLP